MCTGGASADMRVARVLAHVAPVVASGEANVSAAMLHVAPVASSEDPTVMLRKIRSICGPFTHHGHVVKNIEAAMEAYLAIGMGPWFFHTRDRKERWDKQAASGGGRKGKLRDTQLHYGVPTAYRELIAFCWNGETGIELIQPYNDEPSCHNDWLATRGNGLQHINFSCPPEHYVELVDACIACGWLPSIQLIEGDGKAGSGPPGRPDMPTVHYFDTMDAFGYHIELSMGSRSGGARGHAFQQHMAQLVKDWDGKTDPIRGAYPKIPR